MRTRLGLRDLNDIALKALPIYRGRRLHNRDALASAIDLFSLQQSVPTAELDALFDVRDQEALFAATLLRREGEAVRASASLYPVGRDLVVSDHAWPQLDEGGRSTVPHDQVMYVGTDSRWLARATVRKPIKAALDLCCGSGIHALLAAAHAEAATAVDINARAVRCTRFNASLMGLRNLEALEGDLYTPVGDRRFDLITANPPFVPAPVQEVGFRDGGPSGEDVQCRIVEGLPHHLAKGGTAQLVTELGERASESLEPRLRAWLRGAPMDIHVVRLRAHSAEAYAIGHAHGDDARAVLQSVDRWAKNLAEQGFARVLSVLIAFRWSDDPWFRLDDAEVPSRDAGAEIDAIFAAERLSRDPDLLPRLRTGSISRTGPVALVETRGLGISVPASIQARTVGQAMPLNYVLDAIERDILTSTDRPTPTSELLSAGARASVPEEVILGSVVSLIRRGMIRPES